MNTESRFGGEVGCNIHASSGGCKHGLTGIREQNEQPPAIGDGSIHLLSVNPRKPSRVLIAMSRTALRGEYSDRLLQVRHQPLEFFAARDQGFFDSKLI